MTLQQVWDKTEEAYVVTSIFGHSEDSSTGGKPKNSAIPGFLDEGFHGDDRTEPWPNDLTSALGSKSLEEYTRSFPNYRVKTAIEIGMNTDGRTISSYDAQMAPSTNDPTNLDPSELSPVTREGGDGETGSLLVQAMDGYDGTDEYLQPVVEGPKTDDKITTVPDSNGQDVEGVRASIILGGHDPDIDKMKTDYALGQLFSGDIPKAIVLYWTQLAAFYAFMEFVFMADGTKLVRVWDASIYPAHALYVGGNKEDQNEFDEGDEWVTQGPVSQHDAFNRFGSEASFTFFTPFDQCHGTGGIEPELQAFAGFRVDGGDQPGLLVVEFDHDFVRGDLRRTLSISRLQLGFPDQLWTVERARSTPNSSSTETVSASD